MDRLDGARRQPRRDWVAWPGLPCSLIAIFIAAGCERSQTTWVAAGWTQLTSERGELPVPFRGKQQTASLIADIDADGVDDIVLAERTGSPSVVWLRRTARGWELHLVESDPLPIEAGGASADIDGDGDTDIVFGADASSPEVWWWENPGPELASGRPWTRRLIKGSGAHQHHDQIFGDFDGNGRPELVFWNQQAKALLRAEVPADPRAAGPWAYSAIYRWDQDVAHEGLAAGDIDGDGTMDLVGGGNWYRHESGERFSVHPIDPSMRFSRAAVGQLVGGGRPEIVLAPGDLDGPARWYEWDGARWRSHRLEGRVVHGHSLEIGDVDGDGNLDVLVAEMGRWGRHQANPGARMLLFRGNGRGEFDRELLAKGIGNHESRLADLDGDGDLDILVKPYNWRTPRVDVLLNRGTAGGPWHQSRLPLDRWRRHRIADLDQRAVFVSAGDLDGDGLTDIAAGQWWWRNPGLAAAAWDQREFGAPLHNLALVYDLDGDDDLDVLGTQGIGSSANAGFAWARNEGDGHFKISMNVPNGRGDFLQGVAAARFTEAGPLEIALSWHQSGNGVQILTVPRNPAEAPWTWRLLSSESQDEDLSAADIDGDGDVDLFLGTAWLENPSPSGLPWPLHTIGAASDGAPDRNRLVDIDGDGRLDAVVGREEGDELVWYRSPEDPRGPWTRAIIASDVAGGFSLDCADLDLDGDVDVVLGEHRGDPNRVLIFENVDRGESWTPHGIDAGPRHVIDHHNGTRLVDIDADGDLDIVSIGWNNPTVWLYENLAFPE